jgi:hypothetical protein
LKEPIRHLKEHSDKKGGNSDYSGRPIKLEDVIVWKNFITAKQVEDVWNRSPLVNEAVCKRLKHKDTDRIVTGVPIIGGMYNEACLERAWNDVHKLLNLAQEKCAEALGHTAYVMMGDGQNAEWISPQAEENAGRKRPDYAGYLKSSTDESQYLGDKPKAVFNRIPGDAKQFRKICREMLPPDGKRYKPSQLNKEAHKVLNQIHGYMDRHEARYGYIITNEELICFRRTAAGWGQLEVSQAIRHDVEADGKTGVLNSKYVLFGKEPAPGASIATHDNELPVAKAGADKAGSDRANRRSVSVPFSGFIKSLWRSRRSTAFENKVWMLFWKGSVGVSPA